MLNWPAWANVHKLFTFQAHRRRILAMKCTAKLLTLTLFICGFACSMILVAYTNLLTLRGRLIKPLQENHVVNNHPNANMSYLLENLTNVSHPSLPLINFNDLGTNKTKVLLLLIVSTAPQRYQRRQAIRDTWWKHCSGTQVSNKVFS